MQFLKMEDTRPRTSIALILSYKKRAHTQRKRESHHPRNKLERKTQEKQKSRERLKVETEEK